MRLSWLRLGVVALLSCGEPTVPEPAAGGIASVDVTPDVVRLLAGDSVQLTAVARDSAGTALTDPDVSWIARNGALVTVSATGLVRAQQPAPSLDEETTFVVALGQGADSVYRDSARVVVAREGTRAPAPRLGTNLDMVNDWSTEWPFTDLFRASRQWISQRTGQPWGQGGPLALTQDGYVRSLENGQWATSMVLTDATRRQPGGEYALLWEGDGELRFDNNPGVTVLSTAPNRMVARVEPATPVFISLMRTAAGNPVRNIRFMLTADEQRMGVQPFNPAFLRVIRPFGVLRFMNYQATNRTPPSSWANRARTSFATYAGPWGVPVETMVALANEAGADVWFCMPHDATDDYMRQFALLVKSLLGPGQKVYVELSNEIWNTIFPQATYAGDQGMALGLSADRNQAALRWQAHRSVQMFGIWRRAFGNDSARVVRVLASQAVNTWTAEQVLGWQDAYRQADVLAIAPYFGGRFGGRDGSAEAAMSESQLLDALAAEIETTTRTVIESNARIARQYAVGLVAYEGGQHLVSAYVRPEYLTAVTNLFTAVNRHPRMGDLYRRYLEIWYESGGGLFMNFVAVNPWGRYGSWGALEYVHQDPVTSPKYQALLEAAARFGSRP